GGEQSRRGLVAVQGHAARVGNGAGQGLQHELTGLVGHGALRGLANEIRPGPGRELAVAEFRAGPLCKECLDDASPGKFAFPRLPALPSLSFRSRSPVGSYTYVNWSAVTLAEVPPGVVTRMLTRPAKRAGDVATILVAETTLKMAGYLAP